MPKNLNIDSEKNNSAKNNDPAAAMSQDLQPQTAEQKKKKTYHKLRVHTSAQT